MSSVKQVLTSDVKSIKRGRGRPKKVRTPEELAKIEQKKKNKLSLIQKQNLKLKKQKQRQAKKLQADGGSQTSNREKFYCTNQDLQVELLKWRNSANGLKVYKLVGKALVPTEVLDTPEMHEEYVPGTKYFIQYPKSHPRFKIQHVPGYVFYKETPTDVVEDVTELVENAGWAFDIDDPADRRPSNELGNMIIRMADKILNHSNFKNYKQELKEDAKSFFCLKILKGLKNYNFKFNNPFAYFSQCAFNAYFTVISNHYRHINTKKEVLKQLYLTMQSQQIIDPRSSLTRYIKDYIDSADAYIDESNSQNT